VEHPAERQSFSHFETRRNKNLTRHRLASRSPRYERRVVWVTYRGFTVFA